MPLRVVIAEDEAIIRMDLRETLEEEGYEVVGETGRGDQAVELVRALQPDLAILDIKMPGMDGVEAARIINGEKVCGVLMLTAFSQREVVEEARDAGALAFLVKPFQKSDLIPAIEVAMGRFRELRALTGEIDALGEQLEARKFIERAKGRADGPVRHERERGVRVHPADRHERAHPDARRRRSHSRRVVATRCRMMVCLMGTYLVVDGNSLTYRAFFALPTDMATASGQVTNAVFGFTSMLINVLKDHHPDGVLVAFDRHEPTFRHEAEPEYKAQRTAAPDILRQQMGLVREVLDAIGITTVDSAGLGGRRPDRDGGRPARRRRPRRDHRHRRPRQLSARRRPAREGALQPARGQRLRVLRRGRHRGEDRGDTGALPAVRRVARRHRATTCPGCPGWGRRQRRN